MTALVLGTHNRKKGLELAELVAPWGIQVRHRWSTIHTR